MNKGNTVTDKFDNVNPDEVNAKLEINKLAEKQTVLENKDIVITELDKKDEDIVI